MTATIPNDVTASDAIAKKARENGKSQAFPGDYNAMTLREYIATACLQGLLAAPWTDHDNGNLPAGAVQMADALLRELAK